MCIVLWAPIIIYLPSSLTNNDILSEYLLGISLIYYQFLLSPGSLTLVGNILILRIEWGLYFNCSYHKITNIYFSLNIYLRQAIVALLEASAEIIPLFWFLSVYSLSDQAYCRNWSK